MVNRSDEIRIPSGRIIKMAGLIAAAVLVGTTIGATFWKLDLEKRVDEKITIRLQPIEDDIAQIRATLDTMRVGSKRLLRIQVLTNPEAYRAVLEEERMMMGGNQ